jgi:hypothetical protein
MKTRNNIQFVEEQTVHNESSTQPARQQNWLGRSVHRIRDSLAHIGAVFVRAFNRPSRRVSPISTPSPAIINQAPPSNTVNTNSTRRASVVIHVAPASVTNPISLPINIPTQNTINIPTQNTSLPDAHRISVASFDLPPYEEEVTIERPAPKMPQTCPITPPSPKEEKNASLSPIPQSTVLQVNPETRDDRKTRLPKNRDSVASFDLPAFGEETPTTEVSSPVTSAEKETDSGYSPPPNIEEATFGFPSEEEEMEATGTMVVHRQEGEETHSGLTFAIKNMNALPKNSSSYVFGRYTDADFPGKDPESTIWDHILQIEDSLLEPYPITDNDEDLPEILFETKETSQGSIVEEGCKESLGSYFGPV